jgi:hypothetical protein
MGRIILITGVFDIYDGAIKIGEEFVVSHGIDEDTNQVVIVQSVHPTQLGGVFDPKLNEWVIEDV